MRRSCELFKPFDCAGFDTKEIMTQDGDKHPDNGGNFNRYFCSPSGENS